MVGSDGEQDLVRRQVEQAVDPDGSMTAFLGLIGRVPRLPEWLDRLSKGFLGEMKDLSVEHERLLASTAEALEVLGARGWAVLNMNAEAVERACDLVRQGQDAEADELLADEWDEQWRLRRIANRVRAMGAGDEDYQAFFRARGRLLDKASQHHVNGAYEASVPIVLAQIEGITADVTDNRLFFSKRPDQQADVVDPTRLLTIESSLKALRTVYTASVNQTQATGELSRHGILHGRELAYDTRVISAKCWSLCDAMVEWALPAARAEAARRRTARQMRNAGSQAVDEHGRRVDDREFAETCDALRWIETVQMGQHRNHGRFGEQVDQFTRCGETGSVAGTAQAPVEGLGFIGAAFDLLRVDPLEQCLLSPGVREHSFGTHPVVTDKSWIA